MKYAYLWSVQHSGTWLLVNVIDKCSVERVSYVQSASLDAVLRKGFMIEHRLSKTERVNEGLNGRSDVTLFHDHVIPDMNNVGRPTYVGAGTGDLVPERAQLTLAYALPTVITLRDPLRSIITNRQRKPPIDARSVLVNWRTLVIALQAVGEHILVVPTDLWEPIEIIKKTINHLRLERDVSASDRLQRAWPLINTAQRWVKVPYAEKNAYDLRDVVQLKRRLGELWNELCSYEDELRPMLERYGYRDLMWWS